MSKILVLDFDGVLHSYTSGWQGADKVPDPPVDGAIEFLLEALKNFEVHIISSRSNQEGGIDAMREWTLLQIASHLGKKFTHADSTHLAHQAMDYLKEINFSTEKPPAWLTIDDRALCFEGTFPTMSEISNFKPWNKRK